jgi:hypothetical protein
MKDALPSRFSAADFSADRPASSTESSTASIQSGGAPPADPSSTGVSNGSTETIETAQNQDIAREEGSSISSIDPQNTSYFIQYHPELVEKFANEKSTSIPVSSRVLSIVFSRMLFWSKYSKHRFRNKFWFWKSQEELGLECSLSTKQTNRALKVLVEMGLLIREKFHKHYYRQVYFYHIPVSPFTKEIPAQSTRRNRSTSSSSNRSTCRPSKETSTPQQLFHSPPVPMTAVEAPREEEVSVGAPVAAAGGAPVPSGGGGARKERNQRRQEGFSALGAAVPPRPINTPRGFGRNGTDCPYQSTESQSIKNISFKSIIDKCNFYALNPPKPINGIA